MFQDHVFIVQLNVSTFKNVEVVPLVANPSQFMIFTLFNYMYYRITFCNGLHTLDSAVVARRFTPYELLSMAAKGYNKNDESDEAALEGRAETCGRIFTNP
ncbi:MAG: hypothetical protein ACK5BL_00655 [Flavobacteriales bacterium]